MDFNKDYEASVFETTIRLRYKVYVVEYKNSRFPVDMKSYGAI